MAKRTTFKILTVFASLSAFLLAGCLEAPVEPEGGVNGIVYDATGIPAAGERISIGDFPISPSGPLGNFHLPNNIIPYNLTITSYYREKHESVFSSSVKFIGLNTPSPQICDPFNSSGNYQMKLDITIPKMDYSHRTIYIAFISPAMFKQTSNIVDTAQFSFGNYTWTTWLVVPNDIGEIHGKLMYLQALNESANITYEHFGLKDVILNSGNNEILFDSSDIATQPDFVTSNIQVTTPSNTVDATTSASLCFPGMGIHSEIEFSNGFKSNAGSFELPVLKDISYNVKICCTYLIGLREYSLTDYYGRQWKYINPGENVTIVCDPPPVILTPLDGQSNVSDTMTFSISDGDQKGIYVYILSTTNFWNGIMLVTDRKSVNLADFQTVFFSLPRNANIYFNVEKFPGYNSIDDYVSTIVPEDYRYFSVPASSCVKFTTAP